MSKTTEWWIYASNSYAWWWVSYGMEFLARREGWKFDSGQGNHEKRIISFDFAKKCYIIWFTEFIEKNSPFKKTMI